MTELNKLCRICLSTLKKAIDVRKHNLTEIYELLSGHTIDKYSTNVCLECAILLRKVINFKLKCQKSNEIFAEVLAKNHKISKTSIAKYQINASLNYWTEEKLLYIEEYHKKCSKKSTKSLKNEFYIHHTDVAEKCDIKNESDNDIQNIELDESLDDSKVFVMTPKIAHNDEFIKEEMQDRDLQDYLDNFDEVSDLEKSDFASKSGKTAREARKKSTFSKGVTARKPTRKDIERMRALDKRYKHAEELNEEFVVEKFLTEDEQRMEFEKRRSAPNYVESRFKCDFCLKGFREQKLLDVHNKKHERSAGDFVCAICSVRSPTAKRYRTHRDGNHTVKYSCRRCPFVTFNKAQARNHHTWHQGVEHKCPHCDMTFRKYTTFMGHLRILHPSQHICGSCAHSFVSPYGLHLHRKVVHKNTSSRDEGEKSYCSDCDVTFDSYKIYIKHILISPKHQDIAKDIIGCRECGEQFDTKEDLERHTHKKDANRSGVRERLKCTQCEQRFGHPTGVYQHFVKAHPNTPYRMTRSRYDCLCDQCGKTFNCQSKLLSHKRIHTGERPYKCVQCPKTFRAKVYLTKHVNSHKGLRQHVCKVCAKAYSNAGNLFKHMRIHAGVKPFKCEICEKAFVDSSNLRQHIQGVHYNVRRSRKR